MAQARVFVTGGNGFIGRAAIASLRDAGFAVAAAARSRRAATALRQMGAESVRVDVSDLDTLAAAMAGADCVLHLAYDIRAGADSNVALFDACHKAAAKADVGRFVHLSSCVVYDNWPHGHLDKSSTVTNPSDGTYRAAKIAMEERLRAGSVPYVSLQPTLVYGAGSPQWTSRFLAILAERNIVLPEPAGACHAVHVADVAASIVSACQARSDLSGNYLISGAVPLAWDDLIGGYAKIAGGGQIVHRDADELRRIVGMPSPGPAASGPSVAARASAALRRLIGHEATEALVRAASRIRPDRSDWLPPPGILDLMLSNGTVSIGAARRDLGFEPQINLSTALEEIAAQEAG